MRRAFGAEQREELLALGLYSEQMNRLEGSLQSISWRLAPPPRMQDVRAKLNELAKTLNRLERLYLRVSMPASPASGEALTRLCLAQEALNHPTTDTFHDSLETAANIVNRALDDLPRIRRVPRRDGREYVRLILKALRLGHVEHFDCAGYGDTPSIERMPPFLISVTRKKKPFPDIARVVSDASGGWSSDDAIRAYLTRGGE